MPYALGLQCVPTNGVLHLMGQLFLPCPGKPWQAGSHERRSAPSVRRSGLKPWDDPKVP